MPDHKPVAIIPARGGSKRFPRKNIALLDSQPLVAYVIKTALESLLFDDVIISTEDPEIADIAATYGAKAFKRSEAYAGDYAHELDACYEVLKSLKQNGKEPDKFCVLYPTAVFLEPSDLINACRLMDGPVIADVVMGVSEFNYHPYKALKTNDRGYLDMMFPIECVQRSQTYPELRASNGTFYWCRTKVMMENDAKSYYQERLVGYTLPYEKAVDIDYPEDLERIKQILNVRKQNVL